MGNFGYGLATMGKSLSEGLLQGYLGAQRLNAQDKKQKMAEQGLQLKQDILSETQRRNKTLEDVRRSEAATKQDEVKRKAEADKWKKGAAAVKSATDVYRYTKDKDAANKVFGGYFVGDEDSPFKGIELDPKDEKTKIIRMADGNLIFKDDNALKEYLDLVQQNPESALAHPEAITNSGLGTFIPGGMSEAQKATKEHQKTLEKQGETKIGLQKMGLGLKGREVAIKEKAEKRAESGEAKTFKEKKIKEMWDTLSDDERKRILGARIDPHELTEKNILDVYGNLMTDAAVKKALQPIAEKIISRTINKGGEAKTLDDDTAKAILKEAGGDKAKARKIATERGYKF